MYRIILPFLLFFSGFIYSQSEISYSRIKVFADELDLAKMSSLGITVDHGIRKKGVFYISDFSTYEIQKINELGLTYEVLIEDVEEFYESQNYSNESNDVLRANCSGNASLDVNQKYITPNNFHLGSMGGYYTYQEFLDDLDSMRAKFPNLINVKQGINNFTTYEGRPILWVRISDNPDLDENEPEVLYSSIHHAREPASLSAVMFYMWYMLENYDNDSLVKDIVDNTEMYFVPMINPDGYVYNVVNNPNGGGMWRKNRRGGYGVDLNRNYGYQWGGLGTSSDVNSDVYKGSSAFSEPETQAMKWFAENHNFGLALNYHTYSNLLLYPFGYISDLHTPDSNYFKAITSEMVMESGYGNIISSGLYPAAGDSDDWMYGEQNSKNKIFAMTPEIGGDNDGFWPAQSMIIEICKENIHQNIMNALYAGRYLQVEDKSDLYIASQGFMKFDYKRLGLDGNGNFTISMNAISPNISSVGGMINISNLGLLSEGEDSLSYLLGNGVLPGEEVLFELEISNGLFSYLDTIRKIYGINQVIFSDLANNNANWSGAWSITSEEFWSPSNSFTDSPNANYVSNSTKYYQLNTIVDLTNVVSASVEYRAKWDIEEDYDYVQFQVSTNGTTWTSLCGNYTNKGTVDQDENEPLYDGMMIDWVKEVISLEDYVGQTVYFRFKFISDQSVVGDGFYFDDFKVNTINNTSSTNLKEMPNVDVEIYPNPTNDVLYIKLINTISQYDDYEVKLFDNQGKLIGDFTNKNNSFSIDLKDVQAGLYFLQVKNNVTFIHKRVIKQ